MKKHHTSFIKDMMIAWLISAFVVGLGVSIFYNVFERTYNGRIYPHIYVDGVDFGGKKPSDVQSYLLSKSVPFQKANFTLSFENSVATVSGTDLAIGYDATLSATQAYLVGRSGNFHTDLIAKFINANINLTPYFHWDQTALDETLSNLADQIDIPVQEALFQFSDGRVTQFKPSVPGRALNTMEVKKKFSASLVTIGKTSTTSIQIPLQVDIIQPTFTTDRVNSFGIKELIGKGYSEFQGSIQGRIHNVALAAAKLNGVLVKPGDTFSFDEAIGDISAATGFAQAYVIKDGKTVLGDGGGVCQVSTTLFRAALNAGLPIAERHAHAYRVHYYEEGGFKPGIDATVFAPTVDFKFKNDTPGYILIQSKPDIQNLTLTIEFYGTSDGRQAQLSNERSWDFSPAPPDLYQDDPTLPNGTVKQVDFAASGLKTAFHYRVTRGGDVLQDTDFTSNFRPWQAVFLRGTM